ncbi:MAG TPA: hypothetical protein PLJ27_14880 [Polyangiaceae bacterium]|nr:hypothetical protein [Polyangiaceae bacterium]
MKRFPWNWACLAGVVVLACGEDDSSTTGAGASGDAASDSALHSDSPVASDSGDVGADSGADSAVDSGSDTAAESGADSGSDTGVDSGSEAGSPDSGTGSTVYPDDPNILSTIDSIGDNTAVELEPYKLGGARVDEWVKNAGNRAPHRRDFCNKIVYAPDRQTGMYAGMNHGVPHKLNDAWEYHLGSNTWYLLYYPEAMLIKPRPAGWYQENIMIEDGYLQTRTHGMPAGSHTWDGLTYEPTIRRLLWANVGEKYFPMETYLAETGQTQAEVEAQLLPGTRLWMYDPPQGRWFKQLGDAPKPTTRTEGASLEYVSHLKKTVWYTAQWNESGMWLYDAGSNTWESLEPNNGVSLYHSGENAFPQAELQMRYSEKHKKLVAVRRKFTYEYDFGTNTWTKVVEDAANEANDARTIFVYDSVNDVFLLLDPKIPSLRSYSITTQAWTTLTPGGAPFPSTYSAGYFDPVHNVMVVYDSKRSVTWLYRYRQ